MSEKIPTTARVRDHWQALGGSEESFNAWLTNERLGAAAAALDQFAAGMRPLPLVAAIAHRTAELLRDRKVSQLP